MKEITGFDDKDEDIKEEKHDANRQPLAEKLQLLEEAKRAGMRLASKLRSQPIDINQHQQTEELKKGFKNFSKNKNFKGNDKVIMKYFLNGFKDAFDDEDILN